MLSNLLVFRVKKDQPDSALVSLNDFGVPLFNSRIIFRVQQSEKNVLHVLIPQSGQSVADSAKFLTTQSTFTTVAQLCGMSAQAAGGINEPALGKQLKETAPRTENIQVLGQALHDSLASHGVTSLEQLEQLNNKVVYPSPSQFDDSIALYQFQFTDAEPLDVLKALFPKGNIQMPAYFISEERDPEFKGEDNLIWLRDGVVSSN